MIAYQYSADGSMALVDMPNPVAIDGEVLIDVVATGICGTDLKIARGEHRLFSPGTVRVPGHEVVGRVRRNLSDNPLLNEGTLVAVAPNVACSVCAPCLSGRANLCLNYEAVGLTFNGGLAQQLVLPSAAVAQGNAIPVAEGLDPMTAVLAEPVAAVYRGLRAMSFTEGESLLVYGGGPIGLISVILAKHLGASNVYISQRSAPRRRAAFEFGADIAIDPARESVEDVVRSATQGRGADTVMVAAPVPELCSESLRTVAHGGRVNFFAGLPVGGASVSIDVNLVHYRELTLTGSTANTTENLKEALAILEAVPEKFAGIITHRFRLAKAEEAYAAARSGKALKVVIEL